MSQQAPVEFTPPEHLNYPEFTNKEESDKILKLLSSGILRTHADTFNSLDIRYLNNLPGPKIEKEYTFKEIYDKFLGDTSLNMNEAIPNVIITNWEPHIIKLFTDHLNKNKMFLLDEIKPKISTISPNSKYSKSFECVFTKSFYIDSVKKLELKNTLEIDILLFLELCGEIPAGNNTLISAKEKDFIISMYLKGLVENSNITKINDLEVPIETSSNPNNVLLSVLTDTINIEKTIILYQNYIFQASQKEKNYIKEYTEPKLLEDLIELASFNASYPLVSGKNLEELLTLFSSMKIFWLFDTELSNIQADISRNKIYEDLVIKDTIELKPKFKEL